MHGDPENSVVEKQWALKWDSGDTIEVGGSNRENTEEGRQKEILTKPRYTHKSPDTTRLLLVFYRAALRWRNSVTGQFLQRKIWPLSALPPLAVLSLLFSVYPTWYHSVTSAPGPALFSIIHLFLSRILLALCIVPFMFHSPYSIHLHVALLIPLICSPRPSSLLRFSCSALLVAVSMCCPISTYSALLPLILPDSFPLDYPFHSSLCLPFVLHTSPSVSSSISR